MRNDPAAASGATTTEDLLPSGFFVLRTPLLPFDLLEGWSHGLTAVTASATEEALTADRSLLVTRLRAICERPEVREAIFLASPDLEANLPPAGIATSRKKQEAVDRALAKYVVRMASRATPFGLFAGCSLGRAGERARFDLGPLSAYSRRARLDMDYLSSLAEQVEGDAAVRATLVYRPNTSLYTAAGRLRYVESRVGASGRTQHLVAVTPTDYLQAVLTRAAQGARPADLVRAILATDPDIDAGEAAAYIDELIACQVLVSDLALPITGGDTALALAGDLRRAGAEEAATQLDAARRLLAGVGASPPGVPPARYRDVARILESLPAPFALNHLVQVDMIKPVVDATISAAVIDEIRRGIGVLQRLAIPPARPALQRFARDFQERYDRQEVPLSQLLDDETGIGFMRAESPVAEGSPLLAGLPLGAGEKEGGQAWHPVHAWLLARLMAGEPELQLREGEIAVPAAGGLAPLPAAFSVTVAVGAASREDLDAGNFRVVFRSLAGPSGARLLGRFCHLGDEFHAAVEHHLRQEEALAPSAVFAEIVHLPEGRVGNVLARPVLREYEIPFLGRSGAPPARQLPISDLQVSVRDGVVVLRSRQLDREVIPRLTSAHNYIGRGAGVYRFLCALQNQGVTASLAWNWGPLAAAPRLPRVSCGRLVLAPARWSLSRDDIGSFTASRAAGFALMQCWREERGLPRYVELVDGDQTMLTDLDSALSVEVLQELLRRRSGAVLEEMLPNPEELVTQGPEGRFVQEIIVPFVRDAVRPAAPRMPATARALSLAVPRVFVPGSSWIFVKLYCGTASADSVLRRVVGPCVRQASAAGAIDRWFFIRYGDPAWHVRLRMRGDQELLLGEVLPQLHDLAAPLLHDGTIHRLQLDTYEREVERYGGDVGIEFAERLFQADSEAVLAMVEELDGDAGADARWRLALLGIHRLLDDFAWPVANRLEMCTLTAASFGREQGAQTPWNQVLSPRFRTEKAALEALLNPGGNGQDAIAAISPGARRELQRRGEVWAQPIAELKTAVAAGQVGCPLAQLTMDLAHMHANRILRSSARAHEMVIHEFLSRIYRSVQARARESR